jgi:hypothetical protein
MRTFAILFFALLPATTPRAQTLQGVIDIHAHCDPDSTPRSIDAVDLARLAHERGIRGLVLKNHYEPTASLAYIVRKVVPGIEAFGGIDLNRTVGGINPAAVEHMTKVKGGWGRVVWMPTFDAENQVRFSKENRPFVAVSRGGQLLPEVRETIALIARHGLVLATGHSSPAECLMLVREGRRAGVSHMVITHAMKPPVQMDVTQMKQAAAEGAFLEFDYGALVGKEKLFDISQYAAAMRALGVRSCIISSDLGQAGNPLHPDGMADFFRQLRQKGFSIQDIEVMAKKNPATLLGLH